MKELLKQITITDEDIAWVESVFGNIVFDDSRREIIKKMDSFDVQAFPGTGKTTVLVAKLAILAKKWKWDNCGICVLSHTNVAKEEIESRLSKTVVGEKILSHPHFVGTFHSFFDKYLSVPKLRSDGNKVTVVDTTITLLKRYSKLQYGTKQYFENKHLDFNKISATSYPPTINIGCGENTRSFQDAMRTVKQSFKDGYFTFEEMLIVAEKALTDIPDLAFVLQERFPFVLIDETQDTSDLQWKLVSKAFPREGNSVIQRFGDANQAIYDFAGESSVNNSFPEKPILTLLDSKRFGSSIAQIADSLTIITNRGMVGSNTLFANSRNDNTVFIFDDIDNVLPSFAHHVLISFSDEELLRFNDCGVHAIGAVHTKDISEKTDPKYPVGVKDYWMEYYASESSQSTGYYSLIDYCRKGLVELDSGKRENWYALGLCHLLNMVGTGMIPRSICPFRSLVKVSKDEMLFREQFLHMVSLDIHTKENWGNVIRDLLFLCKNFFSVDISPSLGFLCWKDESMPFTRETDKKNVFHYEEKGRKIDIEIGSIHSVKGRTHLATLVLDTFWYKRNIQSIMPWLCGRGSAPGERDKMRIKTHYVALTRAMAMLCLAVPSNSISEEDENDLRRVGWSIQHI